MKVTLWPLDKIIPYARNPRKNDGLAVDKVASSIKEFGWQQAIVVDVDGVIVAGHTRYKAAQKLGLKEAPVHVAKELTPTQIKAYRIADNRVAEESTWDDDLLKLELEELDLDGFDLLATGLDLPELEKLMLGDSANVQAAAGVDDEVEAPEDFKGFDEDIETEHQCPKCAYRWSGSSSAK
jgi:ParB-like chromosome segregation protein Spo0J